jgi:DNA-directed RNA polymerase subunit L
MEPTISQVSEDHQYLRFRLSNTNVSLANAIRRILIADIPCIVFRTSPYEKNNVHIEINTTRMNNELIKQRMSCIPIHLNPFSISLPSPIEEYQVEIDKQNTSDMVQFVTTEDIRIKHIKTNEYLNENETRRIFPPNPITREFIDIVRLRPRLSDTIRGEHLKLRATFVIGKAGEDGAFNVISTCSYQAPIDQMKAQDELAKQEKEWKKKGYTDEMIAFNRRDWLLLDAQRHIHPDTFDFIIETIGQYTNMELIHRACNVMIEKSQKFKEMIQSSPELIEKSQKFKEMIQSSPELIQKSETTIPNSFDITLINEDYTLGKALEFILYSKHYLGTKQLNFCGFKKPHPHIPQSLIRIGFIEPVEREIVVQHLLQSADELIHIYTKLGDAFKTTEND